LDDFEVKNELVDGDAVLSSEVLDGTSEEALREEELVDPVERRDALVDPGLEEL